MTQSQWESCRKLSYFWVNPEVGEEETGNAHHPLTLRDGFRADSLISENLLPLPISSHADPQGLGQ